MRSQHLAGTSNIHLSHCKGAGRRESGNNGPMVGAKNGVQIVRAMATEKGNAPTVVRCSYATLSPLPFWREEVRRCRIQGVIEVVTSKEEYRGRPMR